MKRICTLLFALVLLASVSPAQNAPARTDLYHVHFAKAALGKGAELGEYLKTADPNVPMSAHHIVLRHQDGDEQALVGGDGDANVVEMVFDEFLAVDAGTCSSFAIRSAIPLQ